MRFAMIMAGGAGTRLWPMSRAGQPKQLIRFIRPAGETAPVSLLELAARRLEGVVEPDRRVICTAEKYRSAIQSQLPDFTGNRLLGEPAPRDTVNAVGFAAAVFAKLDPDAVFAVLTADQTIEPQANFAESLEAGFSLVEQDRSRMVSFGITPTEPATGYGYIEDGGELDAATGESLSHLAFKIERFVEKPPLERAKEYLASGRFFWNAGMFVFSAKTVLERLAVHVPESHAGLMQIHDAWGTDKQQEVLDKVYPTLPKISVDYALMEPCATDPAVTLAGVRMNTRWLDVGSWPSFAATLTPDETNNRTSGGTPVLVESRGSVAVSSDDDHTIALLGCEDLIVVHTPRATLVMPKSRAQELKALHAELPDELK